MEYEIIRSRRRTLAVQIKNNTVTVRAPLRTTDAEIRLFLEKHRGWLEKHLLQARAAEQAKAGIRKLTEAEINDLKKQAKKVLPERAAYWAPVIGVKYNRIAIRCQRTRWGSCSARGNLNFNCLLMLTPPDVIDSIVVHELCHLKHMNHSKRFYAEVTKALPDYGERQQWLKEHGGAILAMTEEP